MGGLVTLSVKVPRELRDKLERYGVKVGEVVRAVLERAVREAELRDLERRVEGLREVLAKLGPREVASLIREDREAK
ncbi:MAG: hypothetical protein DRJ98_06790 [Thermoprotei archaeon]|nr:MAG: hypothetical protein DRJ98_06790 [Thermoprotei archaeon]